MALSLPCRALLYLCLINCEIYAQYHIERWTTENGLPQNSVLAILQTRDGFIWLATNDGLARYDGVKFTVFDSTNSPELCCNRLTALFEDSDGVLWIGTDENKIVRYKDQRFSVFITNAKEFDDGIYSISKDAGDNFVISTYRNLFRGNPGDLSLVHSSRTSHFLDRSNTDWYADANQVTSVKDGRRTTYQAPANLKAVELIYVDRLNTVWIASHGRIWTLRNRVFSRVLFDRTPPEIRVNVICEDPDGDLWLGASNGLYHGRRGKDGGIDWRHAVSGELIRSIYVDREGIVWAGTHERGLIKIQKTVISAFSQRDGLASDNVYPLFEDSRGRIWIGSWPEGVSVYQNGRIELLKAPKGEGFKYPLAFGEDREGRIWIWSDKLWCYTEGHIGFCPQQLPEQAMGVHAIIQDKSGAMWFGSDTGLFRLYQGAATHYTKRHGLVDDKISVLLEDRQGDLWIGAREGLTRFSHGKFTTFTKKDGFRSNHVRALHEDEEGSIWVGFFDGGLSRMKGGKITNYSIEDGLFCKGAFQIIDDDHGNFWLGCNSGIYRVSKTQLNDFADGKINSIISISYGRRDGMRNPECNGGPQPAGFKSRDGTLWFPTAGGVAVVDISKALVKTLPPPLVIDHILVADQQRNSDEPVLIEEGDSHLEIHYSSLSFAKPEAVHFYYLMEGLDRNWVRAGNRRVASFSYLPPGEFRFRLAASIGDGEWNELEQGIKIVVPTPFWQAWWFMILVGLVSMAVGYLYYRRRISILDKRNAEQLEFTRRLIESQENERKRVARELHDDLVQDSASLALSAFDIANRLSNGNEALNQKVASLHNQAMKLTEGLRNLSHSLHPATLQHIGLHQALRSVCQEFATAEKMTIDLHLDESVVSVSSQADICFYRIVQEALRNVAKHAQADSVLVSLQRIEDRVELIVSDDGVGFDAGTRRPAAGLGLVSLQERVSLLGGDFKVNATPGKGVEIIASIPLIEPRKKWRWRFLPER